MTWWSIVFTYRSLSVAMSCVHYSPCLSVCLCWFESLCLLAVGYIFANNVLQCKMQTCTDAKCTYMSWPRIIHFIYWCSVLLCLCVVDIVAFETRWKGCVYKQTIALILSSCLLAAVDRQLRWIFTAAAACLSSFSRCQWNSLQPQMHENKFIKKLS